MNWNLRQNEAAQNEPLDKYYETQVQQQRPESPTVTLTWHVCKYKVQW